MPDSQQPGMGRTAVITGASAGVGRACAHRFARAGFRLALIARDEAALAQTAAEISEFGSDAMTVPLDVADADAVMAAAGRIEERLGPIDIWVNDAMATVFSPVCDITPEEFRRVTEVTYLGYVHGTMAALAHMRKRDRGVIVQVGSALAYRGIPLQAAYCGAKHAIRGFTDSLRTELLHEGSRIQLSMVQLPAVNTPQFDWARTHMEKTPRPVPPVIEPEAAAEAIFKAALHPRREIWVGGTTMGMILGNFVSPSFLDRYLSRSAVGAQNTAEEVTDRRDDNLFAPVSRYHRTRGSFAGEARNSTVSASATAVRAGLAAAGVGLALASILLSRRSQGRTASPLRIFDRRG